MVLGGAALSYERGTPVAPTPAPGRKRRGGYRGTSLIRNTRQKEAWGRGRHKLECAIAGEVAAQCKLMPEIAQQVPPSSSSLQGYLAHKKQYPPIGPPQLPRQRPTVGS